jgi:UDP-3-O-[3-hydroxymyristoyl] glucosamine N-acyltransferase
MNKRKGLRIMAVKVVELAELVGGRLVGEGEVEITGAATIRDARAGDITLADDTKLTRKLAACDASAALVTAEFEPQEKPLIVVDDVRAAFTKVVERFCPPRVRERIGVSPAAFISESAKLGADVDVHPGVTVGEDATIGDGCTLYPGVHVMAGAKVGDDVTIFPGAVLYEHTVVGDRCIVHANAVIGAYGFGYDMVDGRHKLSAQLGWVVLEDDVEVGAATTIDRGTYGPTIVGQGTKIDNQVMIAHNCLIGKHNMICSQVGVAGSATTGDYVVMAGQVGVRDHVRIGDKAILAAKAGIIGNIPEGTVYVGSPATPMREQRQIQGAISRLPEMRKTVQRLEKTIAAQTEDAEPKSDKDAA